MTGRFGPWPNWLQLHDPKRHEAKDMVFGSGPPPVDIYINAVYYPNWRVYRNQPPSSLKLDAISHVFYAFAWVKPDGTVYLSDERADAQMTVDGVQGCLRALVAMKRRHRLLKVILSIGGGGRSSEHFAAVAHDPASRGRFAQTARRLVDTYGLDGIDIDWEYPRDPQQGVDYLHLLAHLRSTLPHPQFLLTSALPAGEWALRNINLAQACAYLDLINVMAYDFSGPWTDRTGHQAQLYSSQWPGSGAATTSCQSAATYLRSHGVPPKKILLGIPAYGRSFLGAHTIGQPYHGHGGEDGTFEYKDLPRPGTEERMDQQAGAAYCVGGDGGFVTYDNPHTVAMKAQFVKQNQLAGLFYWTGTGDAQGSRSLVYTGYMSLHG